MNRNFIFQQLKHFFYEKTFYSARTAICSNFYSIYYSK